MRNQGEKLVVAPRAGFEPATNRLTAGSDPKFVSALYRAGSVPNYAQTSSDKGGSLIGASWPNDNRPPPRWLCASC